MDGAESRSASSRDGVLVPELPASSMIFHKFKKVVILDILPQIVLQRFVPTAMVRQLSWRGSY